MKTLNLKIKIILATVMMLLWVGCSDNDNNNPPDPIDPTVNNAPFTFLKVGYKWEYYIELFIDGELFNSMPMTREIVSEDNGYFEFLVFGSYTEYAYSNGDYWKISIASPNDDNASYILLHRNCYVGQKWNVVIDEGTGARQGTVEVLSVSETVNVPAGIFDNCIKIKVMQEGSGDGYRWLHKDIGEVMYESDMGDGNILAGKLINKNF